MHQIKTFNCDRLTLNQIVHYKKYNNFVRMLEMFDGDAWIRLKLQPSRTDIISELNILKTYINNYEKENKKL